jgi:hypothetical protein
LIGDGRRLAGWYMRQINESWSMVPFRRNGTYASAAERSMILGRTLLTAFLVLGAADAAGAAAAPVEHCLTRAEQRARTAAHAVVPLSRAMRAVRKRGEVIHVRLCESAGHLV